MIGTAAERLSPSGWSVGSRNLPPILPSKTCMSVPPSGGSDPSWPLFSTFSLGLTGFRGKSTRSLVFTMKYIEIRHVPIFSFDISLQLGPCLKGCGVTWADLFLLFQVTYCHYGNMQSRIKHMRCTTPITGKLLDKFIFIFKYLCNILTLGLPHERRVNNVLTGMIGMHIHLGDSKEITRSTAELHQEHLRWKTVLGTSTLRGWTWERPGWHIHPSTKDYPRKTRPYRNMQFSWPAMFKCLAGYQENIAGEHMGARFDIPQAMTVTQLVAYRCYHPTSKRKLQKIKNPTQHGNTGPSPFTLS